MLLQPGKTYGDAIKVLEQVINGNDNVRSSIPRTNSGSFSQLMPACISGYKRWTESAAKELRTVFRSGPIINRLRADMYWLIVGASPTFSGVASMMHTELGELRNYFFDTINDLSQTMIDVWQGPWLVLDTNDLLHYYRFDMIPWRSIYQKLVRVAIPTVVIDEIDSKSYGAGPKIQKRARGVYRLLEGLISQIEADGVAKLNDGTLFEILPDELDRVRLANNDDEIVARALSLKQIVANGSVMMVTRDIGMRARALAQGLAVSKLPDKYLIKEEGLSEAETNEALSSIAPPVHDSGI